jgi:hypothetical protein
MCADGGEPFRERNPAMEIMYTMNVHFREDDIWQTSLMIRMKIL